jgi:hypothetical protein
MMAVFLPLRTRAGPTMEKSKIRCRKFNHDNCQPAKIAAACWRGWNELSTEAQERIIGRTKGDRLLVDLRSPILDHLVHDHHVGMIAEVCRRLIVLHFGNALCFVEFIRNTPLLVQIIFWYFAVLQTLPAPPCC